MSATQPDGARVDPPDAAARRRPTIVIDSAARWRALDPRELWAHRELLVNLVVRDLRLRYKQTALGAAWALLQPTLTMVVFTFLFDRLAGLPSERRPYPVFSYAALLPWTFFATGLARVSGSVVGQAHLFRKVYFPRLLTPVGALVSGVVDLALAGTVLLGLMAAYGVWPRPSALFVVPGAVLLAGATALGVGLWLAALNARYRDVGFALPFVVQLWLFVTPVIYPARVVVEWLERNHLPGWLYGVNPMAGVVEAFRWSLLDVETPGGGRLVLASAVVAAAALVSGLLFFARAEDTLTDVI